MLFQEVSQNHRLPLQGEDEPHHFVESGTPTCECNSASTGGCSPAEDLARFLKGIDMGGGGGCFVHLDYVSLKISYRSVVSLPSRRFRKV